MAVFSNSIIIDISLPWDFMDLLVENVLKNVINILDVLIL